jgi:uncharacterized peroxidase-related enzyme
MSRIGLVNPDSADGEVAEMFATVKARIGRVNNMAQVMANSPAVLRGYLGLVGAMSGAGIGRLAGERIALAVGEANSCTLCLSAHTALGTKAGLSGEEIIAARRATSEDPKQAALVKFARRLIETRGTVTDEDLEQVRAAGFGDDAILEVVAHTALNVLTNYVNKVAGTPIDFPEAPALTDK